MNIHTSISSSTHAFHMSLTNFLNLEVTCLGIFDDRQTEIDGQKRLLYPHFVQMRAQGNSTFPGKKEDNVLSIALTVFLLLGM